MLVRIGQRHAAHRQADVSVQRREHRQGDTVQRPFADLASALPGADQFQALLDPPAGGRSKRL
ncbi:hypothetical protein [Microbispora sp. NBC_01389]|uniref:hypothetical protein n=1 Tax=Microbispora sp. NBC_01389 TaxID=2903584 RepID=UPI0032480E11